MATKTKCPILSTSTLKQLKFIMGSRTPPTRRFRTSCTRSWASNYSSRSRTNSKYHRNSQVLSAISRAIGQTGGQDHDNKETGSPAAFLLKPSQQGAVRLHHLAGAQGSLSGERSKTKSAACKGIGEQRGLPQPVHQHAELETWIDAVQIALIRNGAVQQHERRREKLIAEAVLTKCWTA